VRIALVGVGRMGGAIRERLEAGGHGVAAYDVRGGAGLAPSLPAAAAGADLVFFSLPDEAAVRSAAGELAEVDDPPPLLVDLTSSLPRTTRAVAGRLAARGIAMLDAPLSGGVAGAREGRLTAMVGGETSWLEYARPALCDFASHIVWAGPLGAGHAIKAVNNALSATTLAVTCEMLVRAVRAGHAERDVLARWNGGAARSQNSEVKLPRDILPRTYAAGFAIGLMEKDVATALSIGEGQGAALPQTRAVHSLWRGALSNLGAHADFTRVHEYLSGLPLAPAATVEEMGSAIAAASLLAALELLPVAEGEGVEAGRALDIVNASTGRSEATRARLRWEVDRDALRACAPILTLGSAAS
jgi:3-hydroxyisobutyrate dehydrogenase